MPMTPLRKNQPTLALENPPPTVWAIAPKTTVATVNRPKFALTGPFVTRFRFAQVALRAKKNAVRNAGVICRSLLDSGLCDNGRGRKLHFGLCRRRALAPVWSAHGCETGIKAGGGYQPHVECAQRCRLEVHRPPFPPF